jgi:hypothetical protein
VFECYLDDRGDTSRASDRVACCAGYLTHEDGRDEFSRRWRHLLLKHDLPYFHFRNWIEIVDSRGWDRIKRNNILMDFTRTIEGHDMLGFIVAVDTRVWNSLDLKRRRIFGTAGEFCFQRLMRLVLDRLEAAEFSDTIAIVFDQDLDELSRRANAVKRLSLEDSRASFRVQSMQFSNAKKICHLQATNLLWWSMYKELSERSGDALRLPLWLNALSELPVDHNHGVFEFWDKAYTDRYLTSIEWHTCGGRKAKASKKRR